MTHTEPVLFSSSVLNKWSVGRDLLSTYGWNRMLRVILPWLLVRRYNFYAESLADIPPVPPPQIPVRLDPLTERDYPELMSLRPHHYSRSILDRRLAEGHECVLARSSGTLVHVRWLFKRSVYLPYLDRTLTLAADEIYSDDAYTPPEHRRQGIYEHANVLIRTRLRETGYVRIIYAYASWQALAEKKARRSGDHMVGGVSIIQWPRRDAHAWRGAVGESEPGRIRVIMGGTRSEQ